MGKSTLFNAITGTSNAMASNYPFCTIDPNIATVPIIDNRLDQLQKAENSNKIIYVQLECRDIAGLVEGAHKGKGRGNDFLKNIQDVDLIVHLVRGFHDDNILHETNEINPDRDLAIIQDELICADIQRLEKHVKKVKELQKQIDLLFEQRIDELDTVLLKPYNLFSLKPAIYAINISEDQLDNPPKLKNYDTIPLAVKIEEELSKLPLEERESMMQLYNLKESGLNQILKAAYKKLNLITYFTVGPQEARGWTIQKGYTAPEAAGVIHSDFEKKFIAGEVVSAADYIEYGRQTCKEKGLIRTEGKGYVVQDGDLCLWKINK